MGERAREKKWIVVHYSRESYLNQTMAALNAFLRFSLYVAIIASTITVPMWPQNGGTSRNEANLTKPSLPGSDYVLGADDEIIVRCLGADEFNDKPIRIGDDGAVSLPLVGRVKARGLTLAQFEADLDMRLRVFMNRPQVTVNMGEFRSQPVTIIGAVNAPGVHQLIGRKTVMEMLSLGGGLRQDAAYSLKLIRAKDSGPIPLASASEDSTHQFSVAELDLKSMMSGTNPADNIEIRPKDIISVPRADIVYVIGEVHKPGGFALTDRKNVTVLQALSMAEGLQHTALGSKARIFRRTSDPERRTEISVNLDGVLRGKTPDTSLMADDILFIPDNKVKSVGIRTLEAIVQTGSGVLIYRR